MGAVFLREIQAYVLGLTGFIFAGLFLLFAGIVFTLSNLWPPGSSDLGATLSIFTFIFLVTVPVLTMRLLSEEARQKTDQLLLTSPVPLGGIVLGKYLAALAVLAATLALTGVFPLLLSRTGSIAIAELACSYLGVFLLGASLVAVGVFVSSLTDNLVSSAFMTFGAILLIWAIDWLMQAVPRDRISGAVFAAILALLAAVFVFTTVRAWLVAAAVAVVGLGVTAAVYAISPASFDGLIARVLLAFSLLARFSRFSRGVIAAGPIVFYLSFTAVFLFLTVRVIEKRRWA